MTHTSCDGAGLLGAFRAGVANLKANVDEINALNVFPVPDGDTGSNMYATVSRALTEAETVDGTSVGDIAAAIKRGALHGARGNSGVIVSQIFGGMADAFEGKRRFNGLDLAYALQKGVEQSYRAVSQPVEGTILTVIRDVADAARTAAEHDRAIETVLTAIVDAAARSVARTPSLLPILREAGVVDSGGQGLYRLLQGALVHLVDEVPTRFAPPDQADRLPLLVAHADKGHGYETVFFVRPNGHGPLDLDAIRDRLTVLAESVIVAGDTSEAKIHVHNERPDEILGYGLSLGDLSDITVVNLDLQAREVRDGRVAELVRVVAPSVAAEDDVVGHVMGALASEARPTPSTMWIDPRARGGSAIPLAVLAVASGEGLEQEFRDRGASAIVHGRDAANPSTGELLAAIDRINAAEVVILPNNPNVVLVAHQAAELATRPVHVVPTRNPIEGLEAILAIAPGLDVASNVARMLDQSRTVRTFQVTGAVRDARIGDRKVKKGQTIVFGPDEGLVSADRDRSKALLVALATLSGGFELVNILYGEGAELAEAEALAVSIRAAHPHVEIDISRGGQPLYPFLIAVW